MKIQFDTAEGQWNCDFAALVWHRPNETGILIPQGYGVYSLSPRTSGLMSFGIFANPMGRTITIYLRANVPAEHFTLPEPIESIKYEVLQPEK